MTKKLLLLILSLSSLFINAQVANDDCVTAQAIVIPASGSVCVTGTTANAVGTTFTSHPCWPVGPSIPDVWYTFITNGAQNTVTVSPFGAGAAQQVGVTLTDQPCGSGGLSTCAISPTAGGQAVATYIYPPGVQVWVNVGSMMSTGGFQICINSITPPPAAGGSCATAAVLCDRSTFTLPTFPGNVSTLQPSCFGNTFQDPVFYQFTVGQAGTCEWTCDPLGNNTELDWVMYDITNGCPNNFTPELACNFFYAGSSGAPAGMSSTLTYANCPITNGLGPNSYEYCAPANLVLGNTYLLIIDNYSAIDGEDAGFTLSWGGTFQIAPTSQFSVNTPTGCNSVTTGFTNNSVASVSQTWNFGNGNTSTAVNPPSQTYPSPGNYLVSLVTTSATGCTDVSSQTVIVSDPPTMTPPPDATYCAGVNVASAALTSTPTGATFAWTNNNTAIGLAASGTGNIPAFTAANTGSAPISATITITPTLGTCAGTPVTYSITVNPTPTITAPTSQTVCNTANTTAISFSPNPATATVNWTNSNASIGIGTSGSGDIASFTGTNATAAAISGNFVATPTENGCTGTPANFTITINPTPSIPAVTSQTVCEGSNTTAINFNPTPGATTVNWTNSDGTIGIGTSGAGNIAAFTGTNAGTSALTGNFVATPTLSGCTGTPQNFSITVNPLPTIGAITNQTVCAGVNTTAITFNPNPGTTTVNWTNSDGSIGIGTSGSGDVASFAGTNATAAAITGNFTATPSLNGCTGTPQNFSITVDPIPSIPAITSQSLCSGASTTAINFNPTPATATVNWTNTNGSIGIGTSGVGNIASFTGTNSGASAISGSFAATPTLNGCTGTTQNFDITVTPLPSIPAVTSQTVCAGANTSVINFNATPATATINWSNTDGTIGIGTSGIGDISAFTGANSGSTTLTGNFTATPSVGACIGSPQNFSISIDPLPVIAAITSQTICAGASTTVINFNPTPATATINWTNSDGTIGIGTSGSGNIGAFVGSNTGSGITTGNFVATPTLNGCVGSPQNFSININPLPVLTAISNQSVCPAENTSAISFVTNPTGATINWTNSDGTIGIGTSGVGDIASFAGVNAGTTAVSGNFTATPTLNSCIGTAQNFTITIDPLPIPVASNTGPYCANGSISLTGMPNGMVSYSWTGPSFTSSLQNDQIAVINTSMTGVYTLTVIDANGCTASSTTNVTVNPLPTVSANNNSPLCDGATLNLTSTGGVSYSWSGPNTFTSPNQNPSITGVTVAATGNYSVTVTDANGCVNANVTVVQINPNPVPTANTTGPVCLNTQLDFSLTQAYSGYSWTGPNGFTSSQQNPSILSVSAADAGTYSVTVTDANGCQGTTSVSTTIHPLPSGTINPVAPGCAPVCTDIYLSTTDNLVSYSWSLGNTTFSGNDTIINNCYADAGVYSISVLLTDINNCTQTMNYNNWVTVYANPVADFTFGPETVTILEPEINFTDMSLGSNIIGYSWQFGDPLGSTSGIENPTFAYSEVGTYMVTLAIMNSNLCVDTIVHPVVIPEDWAIYIPNAFSPNDDGVNDFFYPKGIGINETTYQMWIYDRWGNLIYYTKDWNNGAWDGRVQGHTNIVQEDVYIWKIMAKSFKADRISKVGHVTVVR